MTITQLSGRIVSSGFTSETTKWSKVKGLGSLHSLGQKSEGSNFYAADRKGLGYADGACSCSLSAKYRSSLSPLVIHRGSSRSTVVQSRFTSDCSVESADFEETWALGEENDRCGLVGESFETKEISVDGSEPLDVRRELVLLSLPAIAGQAIDPLALLMETAYIGRLGSVELGSAGVSMSVFNIISKLFNIPLLSVATSFVAEDLSKNASQDLTSEGASLGESLDNKASSGGVAERKQLSSVSTALLLAVGIGLFEALALSLGSGLFLRLMGLSQASEMYIPAWQFLSLRAIGAPAFVMSLALQGIFRGFKDTKTPVFCLGIGNLLAVFLFPLLIYQFQMGVAGAAISTVISQYIVAFLMIWHLNKRVVLLPPKMGQLQFGSYLKSGGFVLGRTLAVLMTMTVATSMAARQGSVAMAAHQICMQVWLAVSLLTDALAASGQALIASSASKGDFKGVKKVTSFVLKIGLITGISLAAILGLSFSSLATLFSKDTEVLRIVRTGVLFVAATQPITALAFIFDGLHYGMSDFPYAARSMMLVGALSSSVLLYAPSVLGLHGVWFGLAVFMTLRTVAGFVRLLSKTGPWWFMHGDIQRVEVTCGSGNNMEVTGGHKSPLKQPGSFS